MWMIPHELVLQDQRLEFHTQIRCGKIILDGYDITDNSQILY